MSSPAITSNFNGSVLDYIITEAVVGNEAFDKGSVYVMEDVQEKISIAKMTSSANPIIAREAMPTTKSATVTWSEATLEPADMMIYIPDINPRLFENVWREFQPKGALPDKVLDPRIQKTFADVVLKQAQYQIGKLLWQGDTTAASSTRLNFFNGYCTRAVASATNIDVTNIGVISAANVMTVFENVIAAIPDALFENPDFYLHMSTATFRIYQRADRALTTKGEQPWGAADQMFGNVKIRHYSAFPANQILGCVATNGTDSNLYAAVDKVRDVENFKIERLRPEGEHFFLKALFKMDANFSIDSESVFYAGS
jgi:hypothetical protein